MMKFDKLFMGATVAGLSLLGETLLFTQPSSTQTSGVNTYKISAVKYYIVKDQKKGLVNFEGDLELRGKFTVNNNASIYYPSSSSSINAGKTGNNAPISKQITTITASNGTEIPLEAELWEIDGLGSFQNNDDHGVQSGKLTLDGSNKIEKTIQVIVDADSKKEQSATIEVTFVAEKL